MNIVVKSIIGGAAGTVAGAIGAAVGGVTLIGGAVLIGYIEMKKFQNEMKEYDLLDGEGPDETPAHGEFLHVSGPECSQCYLGFEATDVELRKMLWMLCVTHSEEVSAEPETILNEIHKLVVEKSEESK